MSLKYYRLPLLFVLCLCLGACFGKSAPVEQPTPPPTLSPVPAFLSQNGIGATATIEDDDFGGNVRITVEDEYLAATGERCRRGTILSEGKSTEVIVICRPESSQEEIWHLMPRIWGQ